MGNDCRPDAKNNGDTIDDVREDTAFSESRSVRMGRLVSMGTAYAMGTFNDNFFKQAALLLAALAALEWIQGVATVLFALPFVLFSAWGGWLADVFPKKYVIVRSKYMELFAMLIGIFALCSTDFIPHWWGMVAVVFFMGLQSTFFSPALNGAIPENFPAAEVPKVNAWFKLVTTATILMGFGLAGVVLELPAPGFVSAILPEGNLAFGRVAIGLCAVMVSLLGIVAAHGIRDRPRKARPRSPFPWFGPIDSCRYGLDCRKTDAQLYVAIIGEAFFYCLASFVLLCIPNLGVGLGFSLTISSLFSVALSVGICIGSLLAANYVAGVWRRLMVPAGVGMGLWLMAAAFVYFFHPSLRLPWLLATFAAAGVCGGLYLIPLVSFIQIKPQADEKGKVLGVSNFASFTGILLAGFVFTPLGSLDPALLLLFAGLGVWAFLSWVAWRLQTLQGKSLADARGGILSLFLRTCVWLRYNVSPVGMEKISAPDSRTPILFLPNHPALVDPIIVFSQLAGIRIRPLADENQLKGFLGGLIAKIIRAVCIPDLGKSHGVRARNALQAGMDTILNALRGGDSVLLYPAGRIYRTSKEYIGGNSGAATVLCGLPNVRVVLVRTSGLWGSSFGYAPTGGRPSLIGGLLRGAGTVLVNLIAFTPRRKVTMEFVEQDNLPPSGDRRAFNQWLETFYNETECRAFSVPRFFWQGSRPRPILEPTGRDAPERETSISPKVREAVYALLREAADLPPDHMIGDDMVLAVDLGLDSLKLMELSLALESVEGFPITSLDSLVTVQDCLLAASGMLGNAGQQPSRVPKGWFKTPYREDLVFSEGAATIPDAFLSLVRAAPSEPLCSDRASSRTRRDVLTGALVLSSAFRSLPGERVGIMLPSTPAVAVVWLALLLAGKTPVFLNWTVGLTNMRHCVKLVSVSHIITASALLGRLDRLNLNPWDLPVKWVFLEKTAKSIGMRRKILGALKAGLLRSFAGYPIPEVAAVMFTSGSETTPKAVPLTHKNLMINSRDAVEVLGLKSADSLLAMLPPFHSFGLLLGIVLPLAYGLRSAYYPNPTDSGALTAMVRDFKLSLLATPPTFLNAMLERASGTDYLASLRLVFVGAEISPNSLYRSFATQCPEATLCEGYGITECSPIVSVNCKGSMVPGSVGHAMASVTTAVVLEDDGGRILGRAHTDETGMLLVRGPSIFDGYLGEAPSPFVEFENEVWYRTGDLISQDADGRFFFKGRLKRFTKIGGEMVSLPQIEEALLAAFSGREDAPPEGPALAVDAVSNADASEIVCYSPMAFSAKEANTALRAAGLSPIYSVRRIVHVAAIPMLGSGKTDYRELKAMAEK